MKSSSKEAKQNQQKTWRQFLHIIWAQPSSLSIGTYPKQLNKRSPFKWDNKIIRIEWITWQNGHRLTWPSLSSNAIGSSCVHSKQIYSLNYPVNNNYKLNTMSCGDFLSERSRFCDEDGHGESTCQSNLHCEQKAYRQVVHTTSWLLIRWWLWPDDDNMLKNVLPRPCWLFFFLEEAASTTCWSFNVHTVSQPGRGHHNSFGSTATSI